MTATTRTVEARVMTEADGNRAVNHTLPPRSGDASTDSAVALLCAAVERGLRDVVVCPGSRSQALALAAAELERVGAIRLHVRIDERSAGFFALGLAREGGAPVAVICTSGTGPANLHPALLEAHHAGVPLIAITADRPPELIGIGANQATVQADMFGPSLPSLVLQPAASAPGVDEDERKRSADEVIESAREMGRMMMVSPGALHLNMQFRAPLSGSIPSLEEWDAARQASTTITPNAGTTSESVTQDPASPIPLDARRTLVIAGADAGEQAEAVAHEGGWPLLAEASSGARFGRNLVIHARELLGAASRVPELRDGIERIIVFGHPTLTREIPALIASDVEAYMVDRIGASDPVGADREGLVRVSAVKLVAVPEASEEEHRSALMERRSWLRAWLEASHACADRLSTEAPAPSLAEARSEDRHERAAFARQELEVAREPVTREMLVDAVWRASWPHDRLVLGASRLIRVLDERVPGKAIRVHANRGLAGIDGTIATALGVATMSQLGDGSPQDALGLTRVLIGDLTLLHDASSLLVEQGGEEAPRMQIIVGVDGGGTIFDGLEVAATAGTLHERVLYTPVSADLAQLAGAYGWAHERVTTRAELEAALLDRTQERILLEVPLPRA